MKKIYLSVALVAVIIFSFLLFDMRNSEMLNSTVAYSAESVPITEPLHKASYPDTAVCEALGQGINIGNSLETVDWGYFGSLYSARFQAALIYNTDPWTAWDASDYVYFDNNGNNTITWNVATLKSSGSAKASNISLHLVNHDKTYEGTSVNCSVKDFSIILRDGRVIQDSQKFIGEHKLSFSNDVTEYVSFDISQYNLKTSDLIGSRIIAKIEISDFFRNIKGNITSLEQFWGNPVTTEDMIKTIKMGGFKTVRIPVSYLNHISDDGTIDKEFLDRVEQIVDWIIANDMYCIIDIHHDTGNYGWIKASEENYSRNREKVAYIFRQIATRFKDKSELLILEGLNETVNDSNQWGNPPVGDIAVMNKWNQLFVDSVRSTGGNNVDRYLIVNTYAAAPTEELIEAFVMPRDSASNRIFVGIHCYYDLDGIDAGFNVISKYSSKYRFIIGEWGYDSDKYGRTEYPSKFISYAKTIMIPTVYWDAGGEASKGLFDRNGLRFYSEDALKIITGQ